MEARCSRPRCGRGREALFRGALALSTTPLITMLVAALLGIERLTLRKSVGLVLAMGGVAIALGASLSVSPPGAWRGDALMLAGAACMALYTVWSRPLIRRAGPTSFAVTGMVVGAACLGAVSWAAGGLEAVMAFGGPQWAAALSRFGIRMNGYEAGAGS